MAQPQKLLFYKVNHMQKIIILLLWNLHNKLFLLQRILSFIIEWVPLALNYQFQYYDFNMISYNLQPIWYISYYYFSYDLTAFWLNVELWMASVSNLACKSETWRNLLISIFHLINNI